MQVRQGWSTCTDETLPFSRSGVDGAGLCFCHFYYTRYQSAVTEFDIRINSFDMLLAKLEGFFAVSEYD